MILIPNFTILINKLINMKPQKNIGGQILFPVGYHNFNSNRLFNYQLNRWYSFGYFHFNVVSEIGRRLKNFADWQSGMMALPFFALNANAELGASKAAAGLLLTIYGLGALISSSFVGKITSIKKT